MNYTDWYNPYGLLILMHYMDWLCNPISIKQWKRETYGDGGGEDGRQCANGGTNSGGAARRSREQRRGKHNSTL